MPETIPTEVQPVAPKTEAQPEKAFVYKRDGGKRNSIRQIVAQGVIKARKARQEASGRPQVPTSTDEKPIPTPTGETIVPTPEAIPVSEPKAEAVPVVEEPKIDPKQIAEETAKRVAEETKASFREEIQKILDKDKSVVEKQAEADELIAAWDKEERLPKTYKEVIDEALRVSEAKFNQLQKAKEEADTQKQQETQTRQQQEQQVQNTAAETVQKSIQEDLDDLYIAKLLKKPLDATKQEAEDMAETNDLLQFAIKLQQDRAKAGEKPVSSLSKIYFLHYKPFKDAQAKTNNQPAGADAPVSGAKATPQPQQPEKAFVWKRDSKKTYRQILQDSYRKQRLS